MLWQIWWVVGELGWVVGNFDCNENPIFNFDFGQLKVCHFANTEQRYDVRIAIDFALKSQTLL